MAMEGGMNGTQGPMGHAPIAETSNAANDAEPQQKMERDKVYKESFWACWSDFVV